VAFSSQDLSLSIFHPKLCLVAVESLTISPDVATSLVDVGLDKGQVEEDAIVQLAEPVLEDRSISFQE
jgi:hypothetical protein